MLVTMVHWLIPMLILELANNYVLVYSV